jgi:predicted DNA-binding transcriptional regulator YafY
MKLLSAIKSLITEGASIDDIKKSIEQRQVCSIYYEGDEPGGRGLREIEPVALGRSKAGNLVLRGWDREGSSHTAYKGEQPLPSWRLFRVDKITMYKPLRDIFTEPKPGYNFNGDRSMTQVIIIAKFPTQTEYNE